MAKNKLNNIKNRPEFDGIQFGRLIRYIPNKRAVYEGTFAGSQVIIKIFLSPLLARFNFNRELKSLNTLNSLNLDCPKVIASGKYFIITEKINNSSDVFTLIQSNQPEAGKAENKVFEYLAKMHNFGIYQKDLHFGNFLWNGKKIYAVDTAEMLFFNNPLNTAESLNQLAVLLCSLGRDTIIDRNHRLDIYCKKRKIQQDNLFIASLDYKIAKILKGNLKKTLKKTLRTSKRYIQYRTSNIKAIFSREIFGDFDISRFCDNIDNIMQQGSILKNGNTCYVSKVKINNHELVIKRYNNKGLLHSIRHSIKGSRAKKCWVIGNRLVLCNINTPKPAAFIEKRKFGIITQSYIITEFIQADHLTDIITSSKLSDEYKQDILADIKLMLAQLYDAKITHNDLKPSNILISKNKPILIDLDSTKLHRCKWILNYYTDKMHAFFYKRIKI